MTWELHLPDIMGASTRRNVRINPYFDTRNGTMHRNTAIFLAIISAVSLSDATLAEEAGVRLSKEELTSFLPGTKAVYVIKGGSTHSWTNEPEGKFVASTDAKTLNLTGMGSSYTARGTWRVSDDGKYCISIEWRRYPESWCRFVYRAPGGGYYMTETDDPSAEKRKIELTR
jgi:hypothetical protein